MKRAMVLILLAVTACGTPQQQCVAAGTRDLGVVDRLIAESEANIARGYAWQDVTVFERRWVECRANQTEEMSEPKTERCLVEVPETIRKPLAIDLAEEASTLASLKAKRADQQRSAQGVIKMCKEKYPD